MKEKKTKDNKVVEFSGNIFIFQAFDIGDDINLDGIAKSKKLIEQPKEITKYFKNYHTPLTVELPHPHHTGKCTAANIHHFGAVSLAYQIPFESSLEKLRQEMEGIYNTYQEQSVSDIRSLFNKIKRYIYQAKFFQHRTSYVVIQVDPNKSITDINELRTQYGGIISSMLRLEDVHLSEEQKKDILEENIGYYRKDFIIIDTESAFVYDDDYSELLTFFEFANIQQLELQYFDKILDKQLNTFYEQKTQKVAIRSYLPFIGMKAGGPIEGLDRLRVDIAVITERLENSIKLAGEAYYSELYSHLTDKLELDNWKDSIEKKLAIIRDIKTVYNDKINTFREHMLEILIIILILIELIVGFVK